MFSLSTVVFQEYINERVKKIGGATSFNLYLMKELEVLYTLLVEIKSTLQVYSSFTVTLLGPINMLTSMQKYIYFILYVLSVYLSFIQFLNKL